jgi:hypothetical protein
MKKSSASFMMDKTPTPQSIFLIENVSTNGMREMPIVLFADELFVKSFPTDQTMPSNRGHRHFAAMPEEYLDCLLLLIKPSIGCRAPKTQ